MDRLTKKRWLRRLARLHDRLLQIEAVAECLKDLRFSMRGWRTGTLSRVLTVIWLDWSVIQLRAVCKKGPSRYKVRNVSLEGLLEEVSAGAEILVRVGEDGALRKWLKKAPTELAARTQVNRDKDRMLRSVKAVKGFGDHVAHIQFRPPRIAPRRLIVCLAQARRTVHQYHTLLTGEAGSDRSRIDLVHAFEDDLDRIEAHVPKPA